MLFKEGPGLAEQFGAAASRAYLELGTGDKLWQALLADTLR